MNELVNAVIVLAVLIPGIILVAYALKKILIKKSQGKQTITVLSQLVMGSKERIVLLQINQEQLLIGVTPQAISLLKTYSGES